MGVYYFYSDSIYNDGKWTSSSIYVDGNKFMRGINRKQSIEMDVSSFWVGPGKAYVDMEEPLFYLQSSEEIEHAVKKYIYRGCTLLICQMPIKNRMHYRKEFLQFQKKLASLPIDFMIVPKITLSRLQPDLIRFFGRKKAPFIIVEIRSVEEMLRMKWEWIEAAQSFSRIPLASTYIPSRNAQKEDKETWRKICTFYQLSCLQEEITALPLSKESLRLAGISPFKGEYFHQGYADYNLFDRKKSLEIDEQSKFRYHKAIPDITVSNGNVVKTNHLIDIDHRLTGSYRQISIPRHFVTY